MNGEVVFRQKFEIAGGDFSRGGEASCEVKNLLKEIGLPASSVRRAAIASYEAEMNVIMYAEHGVLDLIVTPLEIRIDVGDSGPGIPDIELAMNEGFSTATPEMRELGFGAGMGLSNIKKNADRFDLASEVGKGTRLSIVIRAGEGRP